MGTRSEFLSEYGACVISLPTEYKLQNKIQSRDIFSVDKVFFKDDRRGEHCDEFIFFDLAINQVGIYLVERKTNTRNMSHIVEQLQGGAQHIECFRRSNKFVIDEFDFIPVLVSKKKSRSKLRAWKEKSISLKEKNRNGEVKNRYIYHIERKEKLPYI